MNRNKKILLSIISIIAIVALGTYAWIIWNSPNNTSLITTIGQLAEVSFKTGNDISASNMGPVLNPDVDGEITTFSINNKSDITYDIEVSLNIVSIASQLQKDSFKYKLLSSSTQNGTYTSIANGTFENIAVGKNIILETTIASTTKTYYKFIMYIDGTMENDPSMMNKSISGTLDVSANYPEPANEKIIELAGDCTSWSSGFSGVCATNSYDDNGVTKYHEYRYVGGEVDNYVLFNDELYRIIGVFDDYSHGVTGQYLVKLISARELTAAAWGTYNASPAYTTYSNYKNDWTGTTTGVPASANILLNEFYLNPTATSTYGECIDWTYGSSNNTYKSKNCSNIKGYGIQTDNLRNYIQPVTWYLYGYTSYSLSKQNFYQCERNNYSGCTSANSGAYSGTTTASIGLMYVSDYLYASGYIASNDTSTTASSSNFINLNWLYNGYEWTITPTGNSGTNAFLVYSAGYVRNYDSCNGGGLRPTFYLKSTIKIKSGDGTFKNPYTIG